MAIGRRFLNAVPKLTRRAWEDVAPQLEDFLRRLWDSEANGVPAGFNDIDPSPNVPDQAASPGTENQGWAAADHVHATDADTAVNLVNTPSAEGNSTKLARADHEHQRDVWVEEDGTDLGTVNALNFTGGLEAEVAPNLTGSLLTNIYGYWSLDEEAGSNRVSTLGTAPDLTEVGGAVPAVTGRFGKAASSTEADAFALQATLAPAFAVSAGFTVALWFQWPTAPSIFPDSMFFFENVATTGTAPWVHLGRYYDSNFLDVGFSWAVGQQINMPLPRLGELDVNEWHLVVFIYEATTGKLTAMVDEGCLASAVEWTSLPLPALKLSATVPGASLAAANAITFDTLKILKSLNINFRNFEGEEDSLAIWPRPLTALEVEQLWISVRADVSGEALADDAFIWAIVFGGR